jgi:hypothetical protein
MTYKLLAIAICLILAACGKAGVDAPAPVAPEAQPEPATAVAGEANAAAPESANPEAGFSKSLELQGITFKVEANAGSLTITPAGLEAVNEPVTSTIEGKVTGAEVADLDADGSPEVYVFLQSGDGARGGLVGYSSNKRKSMSQVSIPALADDPINGTGYQGHDEFAMLENRIGHRFPIAGEDGKPTGKFRQLQYKLAPGEAGWQLVLDRTSEF